ncbi:hypothetical protein DFH08DRAFT_639123, partial [Mycena albidolilacea]
DSTSTYFLAHSASGVYAFTLLFMPSILSTAPDLHANIKGTFIASAQSHFKPTGHDVGPYNMTNMYYGSPEEMTVHALPTLFQALPDEGVKWLSPLTLIECEHDPQWFKVVVGDFHKVLGGRAWREGTADHNHISFSCAVSMGQGEGCMEDVMVWI